MMKNFRWQLKNLKTITFHFFLFYPLYYNFLFSNFIPFMRMQVIEDKDHVFYAFYLSQNFVNKVFYS